MRLFKLVIGISLLVVVSCEDLTRETYRFNLANRSEIIVGLTRTGNEDLGFYPDTVITRRLLDQIPILEPGLTLRLGGFRPPEEIFDEQPSDTISVYFFDAQVLEGNSFEDIQDNYRVLKRYDLSAADMKLIDYEVPYPPTPEMSQIKQYPAY